MWLFDRREYNLPLWRSGAYLHLSQTGCCLCGKWQRVAPHEQSMESAPCYQPRIAEDLIWHPTWQKRTRCQYNFAVTMVCSLVHTFPFTEKSLIRTPGQYFRPPVVATVYRPNHFIPRHSKYSQSEYRKSVIYSTVLHPTFPSSTMRTSYWLCCPQYFLGMV